MSDFTELRELRHISILQCALAGGSKAEIAILKALYENNAGAVVLYNDNDAMLPVAMTLDIMRNTHTFGPEIPAMRGFGAFMKLLEALDGEGIAYLVLDTKRDKR